jgi:hypothetical protein
LDCNFNPNLSAEIVFKERIYPVFMSRRCTNCHGLERPLQYNGQLHSMNMARTNPALGLQCWSCHGNYQYDIPNFPPGAPHWGMPAPAKHLHPGMTAKELEQIPGCRFLKKGSQRSLEDMVCHIKNDPLVIWAWSPGPSRDPADKCSHELFAKYFESWVEKGATCPQ